MNETVTDAPRIKFGSRKSLFSQFLFDLKEKLMDRRILLKQYASKSSSSVYVEIYRNDYRRMRGKIRVSDHWRDMRGQGLRVHCVNFNVEQFREHVSVNEDEWNAGMHACVEFAEKVAK